MNTLLTDERLETLADDLAHQGWAVRDEFLPPGLIARLALDCRQRQAQGLLERAAVGRGSGQAIRETVRGDSIEWLEPGLSPAVDAYLAAMQELREGLNRSLYLGLADYECHFTLYPPGSFYQRHLDRFRDDDRREISAVFYLNEQWGAEDGGALRLYLDDRVMDLAPLAGRLVLFRSAQWPHEVLPATRERLSLTGWFRRRGDGVI